MKSFIFTLLLTLLSSGLLAEDLLSKKLSVSFYNTPIKTAMDEIARLADFEWAYNTKILEQSKMVTIVAKNWTVREVLLEILGPEYQFKENGHYLILKRQKLPPSVLSGIVRDPRTGERVANATVYDRKTLKSTTTDSSGYYRLKVKQNSALVVSRLGYRDTVLQVNSMSAQFQKITLAPVLSEPIDSSSPRFQLKKHLEKTLLELEAFFDATGDKWHELNVKDTLQRKFQASFLPLIGSNHLLSSKVENEYSLNLIAGVSSGVKVLEVAGVANFTQNNVQGVQLAGVLNAVKGQTNGVQMAGVVNLNGKSIQGWQIAGVANYAQDSIRGVQLAGLVNILEDHCKGVQAGGVYCHSDKTLNGVQAAGILCTSAQKVKGVQLAGVMNVAKEINGSQVGGIVNSAKRVKGVQIGLINSADELQGVQIGLINKCGKRWSPFLNWNRGKAKAGGD
jgi:hypothetical protein